MSVPREIIKWIQGLDLSYSFKDAKRDLMNGFLIAEIFTRYHSGKIQMHSLDNSQNKDRRVNNWNIIQAFLKKNDIEFDVKINYKKIVDDLDFDELKQFVICMYTHCTSKKVEKSPLEGIIKEGNLLITNPSQMNQEMNLNQSFILKEQGLEKLDEASKLQNKENKKNNDDTVITENNANNMSKASQKTVFMRNQSKPIGQHQEVSIVNQIDVKSTNVRPIQLNIQKLKEKKDFIQQGSFTNNNAPTMQESRNQGELRSITQNTQSQDGTSLKQTSKKEKVEKSVFDILNELITMKLQEPEYQNELNNIKVKNTTLLQAFMDNVDQFSDEFSSAFFNEIKGQLDGLILFVVRDPNELFRYLNFQITCLKQMNPDKESFHSLSESVQLFCKRCQELGSSVASHSRNIFKEFYLQQIIHEIKNSLFFQRKECFFHIIYSVYPQDPALRHELISIVKNKLNNLGNFLQGLFVFLSYESQITDENKMIIDDAFHYAQSNLFSQSPNERSLALVILQRLAEMDHEKVLSIVNSKIYQLSSNEWWETKIGVIVLFSKLIRKQMKADRFLIQQLQEKSAVKVFNPENEANLQKYKESIQKLANGIKKCAFPPQSETIIRQSLLNMVDLIGDSQILLELFVQLLVVSTPETRQWVFVKDPNMDDVNREVYLVSSDKSLKYKIYIDSDMIRKNAAGIILPFEYIYRSNIDVIQIFLWDSFQYESFLLIIMNNNDNQINGCEVDASLESTIMDLICQINYWIYIKLFLTEIHFFINFSKIFKIIPYHLIIQIDILLYTVNLLKQLQLENLSPEYMDLVVFGCQYADFDFMVSEVKDHVAEILKDYIFASLCDEENCHIARTVFEKLIYLQIEKEVKIENSDQLLSSTICLILQNKLQNCTENLLEILKKLVFNAVDERNSIMVQYLNQVLQSLEEMDSQLLDQEPQLKNVFSPLINKINEQQLNLEMGEEGDLNNSNLQKQLNDSDL